jgi:hypothetical protein
LRTIHFATDRDDQVAKAIKALDVIESGRKLRASVSDWQERAEEITDGWTTLRQENDKSVCQLCTPRFLLLTIL